MVDIGRAVGIVANVLQGGWGHRRNIGTRVVDHVVPSLVIAAKALGSVAPVGNQVSLRATHNREAHVSVGGCALDLLVALLILFLFVALGVLGRADLASLGVDACATLSFAFHYFACGFGGHYVSRCDNACGAILVSGEPNIGTLVS